MGTAKKLLDKQTHSKSILTTQQAQI